MKTWYEKIIDAHRRVTDSVSHYERLKSDRYFVWQETGAKTLSADDIHKETAMSGKTDFFTKIEFDPWKDAFEFAMDKEGVIWNLDYIDYEEETGFIHYQWLWDVAGGGA